MSSSDSGATGVDPLQRTLLFAICQNLVERERRTELVRLCALWADQEPLPVSVALQEARALLDLRLMDLAWVRLRELDKSQRHRVAVQSLTAEMFIERGWPGRARRILERAVQEYPERKNLKLLLARSLGPPLRPPSKARQIERDGTQQEQLALAERYLCAGSQLKARSILKRLRRGKSPHKARVDELMWGLDTDLESDKQSLMAFAQSLSVDLTFLEDSPLDQSLEGLTSAEVTIRGPIPAELKERNDPSFPSLFRWVDDSGDYKAERDEVTRVSSLAELKAEALDAGALDAQEWADEQDTKVMRVIHHDAKGLPTLIEELKEALPVPDSTGLSSLENDVHTASFNLGEMDFETDDVFLEEEDAGLVVMTGQEGQRVDPHEETQAPMRLVERIPPGPEDAIGFDATDPTIPRSQLPVSRRKKSPSRKAPGRVEPPRQVSAQRNVFLGVVLLLTTLIAGLGAWKTYQSRQDERVLAQSLKVIGGGDYQALLKEEARLAHALDQGMAKPLGTHLAAYGLIELTLWGDFSGGRVRWEAAVQAIRDAGLHGASAKARGLAAASRAFFQGDYAASIGALAGFEEDTAFAALLRARVALSQNDLEVGRAYLATALALEPNQAAALLEQADLCVRELDSDCARKALRALEATHAPTGPLRLLRIRLDSMDEVAVDRARIIEQALASGLDLSPRQVGRVRVRLASLYAIDGDSAAAKRAIETALAADSENSAARFASGALRLREGRVKQALSDFRACVRSRPADKDCHSGVIHALLELDRVEEARLHVLEYEPVLGTARVRSRFAAWLAYAGEEDAESVMSHLSTISPRNLFIKGLALGRSGESALAESTLIQAAEGLLSTGNPLDSWMAPRALAAAARFGESEHRSAQALLALAKGEHDPMVLVDLGWYYDSLGQKEEAVALFDRADGAASESALAHFNRGWYFLDFGDRQTRTKASWIRYRDLNPSGSRAERVMSQLLDLY
jgi:predicted Zn-dependent protease